MTTNDGCTTMINDGCTTTSNDNNDERWWLAGPDNVSCIVWAYGIFFFHYGMLFLYLLLVLYTKLKPSLDYSTMTMETNDDNDKRRWLWGTMGGWPRRCELHRLGLWYVFFFKISLLHSFVCSYIYIIYNIFTTQNFGLNQSRPVTVQFFNFLGFGKPVAVAVLPKKWKKPDRTGLLNTNRRWHTLVWEEEHHWWYQLWAAEWVKEGRVDQQLEELLWGMRKIDSGLSEFELGPIGRVSCQLGVPWRIGHTVLPQLWAASLGLVKKLPWQWAPSLWWKMMMEPNPL